MYFKCAIQAVAVSMGLNFQINQSNTHRCQDTSQNSKEQGDIL